MVQHETNRTANWAGMAWSVIACHPIGGTPMHARCYCKVAHTLVTIIRHVLSLTPQQTNSDVDGREWADTVCAQGATRESAALDSDVLLNDWDACAHHPCATIEGMPRPKRQHSKQQISRTAYNANLVRACCTAAGVPRDQATECMTQHVVVRTHGHTVKHRARRHVRVIPCSTPSSTTCVRAHLRSRRRTGGLCRLLRHRQR